jgi:hypothetical protein
MKPTLRQDFPPSGFRYTFLWADTISTRRWKLAEDYFRIHRGAGKEWVGLNTPATARGLNEPEKFVREMISRVKDA